MDLLSASYGLAASGLNIETLLQHDREEYRPVEKFSLQEILEVLDMHSSEAYFQIYPLSRFGFRINNGQLL